MDVSDVTQSLLPGFLAGNATMAAIVLLVWLLRALITERLTNAVRHEYDKVLKGIEKDLDILKEKEVGGHRDRLATYRLVVDVMAHLYADLYQAVREGRFEPGIVDRYNEGWVRCYGYLSILAPQAVMDAFDELNDYILAAFKGHAPLQEWAVSRTHALAFLNAIRRDIGLTEGSIEYKGKL